MGKRFYRFAKWLIQTTTPKMTTEWEVPFDGEPCAFIGNHAGAFGPIDMVAKFPLRDECYPWFNAAVMSEKEMPAYVRQDYWWKPGSFFEPLLNVTLPYIAAVILPPIMRSVPGVPVYHDNRVILTMRKSLQLLKSGKHLIIFPEQPSGFQSHHDWINTGFLNVAPMYHRLTGKEMQFWPVHIDYKRHVFKVSAPIRFDSSRTLEEQLPEIEEKLAKGLRGLN